MLVQLDPTSVKFEESSRSFTPCSLCSSGAVQVRGNAAGNDTVPDGRTLPVALYCPQQAAGNTEQFRRKERGVFLARLIQVLAIRKTPSVCISCNIFMLCTTYLVAPSGDCKSNMHLTNTERTR